MKCSACQELSIGILQLNFNLIISLKWIIPGNYRKLRFVAKVEESVDDELGRPRGPVERWRYGRRDTGIQVRVLSRNESILIELDRRSVWVTEHFVGWQLAIYFGGEFPRVQHERRVDDTARQR